MLDMDCFEAVVGPTWVHFGGNLGRLWELLGGSRGVLGASWTVLGVSLGAGEPLGTKNRCKNQSKI